MSVLPEYRKAQSMLKAHVRRLDRATSRANLPIGLRATTRGTRTYKKPVVKAPIIRDTPVQPSHPDTQVYHNAPPPSNPGPVPTPPTGAGH